MEVRTDQVNPDPMTGVILRSKFGPETHRGLFHLKTDTEIGEMQPRAKNREDWGQPPEAGRGGGGNRALATPSSG